MAQELGREPVLARWLLRLAMLAVGLLVWWAHVTEIEQLTRAPGSNGSGTTPGRVLRGSRRAGHMGVDRVTAQNIKIVMVLDCVVG